MKRKSLEILLSSLSSKAKPKLRFEEYPLDSRSASTMLHVASSFGDIRGKNIIDLGCGSGILSIGSAVLGARRVVGVDIDRESIGTAVGNMESLNLGVEFITGHIDCIRGSFDTTIMNPPFGSWKRGADALFLEKALSISEVVYSIHKAGGGSEEYLRKKAMTSGRHMVRLGDVEIIVPRLFKFHRKTRYKVRASLYRTAARAF